MDMTTLITQMLVLTIVMAIGFLARRTQVMDAGFSRQLSGLLLRIAIPAMIIASVGEENPFADSGEMLAVLGICTLVNLFMIPLAYCLVWVLRIREQRELYQFMFALSNAGFMGLPIITSVFGSTAGVYAALFLLPNNFLMFGYGMRLFRKAEPFSWKQIFNAPGLRIADRLRHLSVAAEAAAGDPGMCRAAGIDDHALRHAHHRRIAGGYQAERSAQGPFDRPVHASAHVLRPAVLLWHAAAVRHRRDPDPGVRDDERHAGRHQRGHLCQLLRQGYRPVQPHGLRDHAAQRDQRPAVVRIVVRAGLSKKSMAHRSDMPCFFN